MLTTRIRIINLPAIQPTRLRLPAIHCQGGVSDYEIQKWDLDVLGSDNGTLLIYADQVGG